MNEKIGEELKARLQSAQAHDTFDVDIFLRAEPAHAAETFTDSEPAFVDTVAFVDNLQVQAANSQQGVLDYLTGLTGDKNFADSEHSITVPKARAVQSFWINNAVAAEVTRDVLEGILERPDVMHVELTHQADISQLIDAPGTLSPVEELDGTEKTHHSFDVLDFVKSSRTFDVFIDDNLADAPQPTWSVRRVNAPLLWQKGLTGDGILVAVVDTGVNYDHPDLASRMWNGGAAFPRHGFDFASNDNDPRDEGANNFGHGTACAGIVAGDGSSGTQTGIAPGARIMALRVGGKEHNFWRALEFAIQQGAQVISMSMTWKNDLSPNYPGWRRICETILAAGVLHANSTGNNGQLSTAGIHRVPFNIGAPGNCPPPRLHPLQNNPGGGNANLSSAVSCGSTDQADRLLVNSGRGPCAWESAPFADFPFDNGNRPGLLKPDVCAPGSATDSCNWRFEGGAPYVSFNGTSSATPHVAGCMALLAHACRRAGTPIVPGRIQEALENTAVRIQGQTLDKEIHFGAGRVDVFGAYNYGLARGWWQ